MNVVKLPEKEIPVVHQTDVIVVGGGVAGVAAAVAAAREGMKVTLIEKTIVSHWFHELDFNLMKKGIEEGNMLHATPLRWLGLTPSGGAGDEKEDLTCDGTTSEGVNEYIRLSRGLARDFIKKHQSPDYCMISLPFLPQFRMIRRLVGNAELKCDAEHTIDHSIGCVIASLDQPATVYEYPYEGLITDKLTNVLAAGRMVSASGRGWAIMRFIPACVLTGQAAGTAAAQAIKDGCTLKEVDVKKLQNTLERSGVRLHRSKEMEGNVPAPRRPNPNPPLINQFCVHNDPKEVKVAGSGH